MTWWCAARGGPWEWIWKPYPGVWLFVLGILAAYLVGLRRLRRRGERPERRVTLRFLVGLGFVWLALDWPLGLLGAGYLLSAHVLQHQLISLIATPLLLTGVPPALARSWLCTPQRLRLARALTRPLPALLLYNGILLLTFVPNLVDLAMPTQLGSFLVDVAWFGSAILMWVPALGPAPELRRLAGARAMAYLFLQTLAPIVPAAFFTLGRFPLYAVYELAPRVAPGLSALSDHRIAGILMKLGGDLVIWAFIARVFFTTYAVQRGPNAAGPPAEGPRDGAAPETGR